MKYIGKITIRACEYGHDPIPAWLRPLIKQHATAEARYLIVGQIKSNPEEMGDFRVYEGDILALQPNGAVFLYPASQRYHFFDLLWHKEHEAE